MAEEELQYDDPDMLKLREGLYLLFANRYKKLSDPMRQKPSIWERIFTTTYTTIDTIGAPGDKMPRERERSFLPQRKGLKKDKMTRKMFKSPLG